MTEPSLYTATEASRGATAAAAGLVWLRRGLIAYPLAWALGLGGVYPLAVSLVALYAEVVGARRPLRVPAECLWLGLFLFAYGGALIHAIVAGGFGAQRYMASMYNWTVWVAGGTAFVLVWNGRHDHAGLRGLLEAVRFLGLLAAGVTVVLAALWVAGAREVHLTAPVAYLVPGGLRLSSPPLVQSMLHPPLLVRDWLLAIPIPRVAVLHPYPNALALSAVFALASHLFIARQAAGRLRVRDGAVAILLLIPIVLTWQRTVFIALAAGAAAYLTIWLRPSLLRVVGIGAGLLIAVLAAPVLREAAVAAAEFVQAARAGSTSARLEAYRDAASVFHEQPLIGLGVKPREEDRALSVGSHSTYLGTLMKSGLLGAAMLALFLSTAVALALRALFRDPHHAVIGVSVGVLLIWLAVEDLDAAALVALEAFVMLGVLRTLSQDRDVRRVLPAAVT
ncbi:MAG TPA: O-antigen ligase family protein [Gemmatimonadaceae bacterium]